MADKNTPRQEMAQDVEITPEMQKKFALNTDPNFEEELAVPIRWRYLFPKSMIEEVKNHPEKLDRVYFRYNDWTDSYDGSYYYTEEDAKSQGKRWVNHRDGRIHPEDPRCALSLELPDSKLIDRIRPRDILCSCREGAKGGLCIHKAMLLYAMEQSAGGLLVSREPYYLARKRIGRIRFQKKRAQEKARHEALGSAEVPALDFFQDRQRIAGELVYDMRAALQGFTTDAYAMKTAEEILEKPESGDTDILRLEVNDYKVGKGNRILEGKLTAHDDILDDDFLAGKATLSGEKLSVEARSGRLDGCATAEFRKGNLTDPIDALDAAKRSETFLNANGLLLVKLLWDKADAISIKARDITDNSGEKFFHALESVGKQEAVQKKDQDLPRAKVTELMPRITNDGGMKLSFRIRQAGGRLLIIRNLSTLLQNYEARGIYEASKKEKINFGLVDFTDESKALLDFLQRRFADIQSINSKIEEKNYYAVRTVSLTGNLELSGSTLDAFYDLWNGKKADYVPSGPGSESSIPVGHRDLAITLKSEKVKNKKGAFAGVRITGQIPQLLSGNGGNHYILNAEGLSRISEKEQQLLAPFDAAAGWDGNFQFQVGYPYLQEFYYRVVPKLLENPGVNFIDNARKDAEKVLPPEPAFAFYLDCRDLFEEEGEAPAWVTKERMEKGELFAISLVPKVSYVPRGDEKAAKTFVVGVSDKEAFPRDRAQEDRVRGAVKTIMKNGVTKDGTWLLQTDAEGMYDFLQHGISVLEEYGTPRGTEAFRRYRIRQVPSVRFGVSAESGLLDLSLTSHDLSEEELLAVLKSYQKKQRFYRLRSGDFLDLQDSQELSEVEALLNQMDLDPEEVVNNAAKIPLYRSLYLDKLLEEHYSVAASRDKVYRSLVRNFRTVKDAEIEPPESLSEVLRPYQQYGFKWIETLEEAGFAGILADEMGLGKTLQMISVLLYDCQNQKSGTTSPSLVVCPASLVYNWQEEFRRFAPKLSVIPITGGAAARKEALSAREKTQVYIISYDLLKRNIAEFAKESFYYVILDEAQYIKNAKAAVSKSVKTLRAQHRFALTGTPIENRLSEFWSIFDFLMPGFLYSAGEFEEKLGIPITKNKDEAATEKLRKMTAPFILRRRKGDVLKDLPEKLEEVRYVPISGEQQKLYDAEVLKLKGQILEESDPGSRVKVFAELTKVREICCDPSLLFENYKGESAKREAVMGLIQQAMDGGHRMLLFSQFTSMLDLLEQDLKKEGIPYYLLTGSTPKEKRIQLVHQFNEGDVPVFLISLKAGGTGLNLTGADVVIHYDPWWNMAAQNQATDRAHRIGQTKEVTVYRMIMKGTIEEKILAMQEAKKDLAESVLAGDAASLSSLSREELLELLS